MIAVTFRARAVSAEVVPELCRQLLHSLERQQTPGWLRGECLVHSHDRRQVLVYEEWASHQSWESWFNSEARIRLNDRLAATREGELQIDVYEEP